MATLRVCSGCALLMSFGVACGSVDSGQESSPEPQVGGGGQSTPEWNGRAEMFRAASREKLSQMNIVHTSITPSGQILDWVPLSEDDLAFREHVRQHYAETEEPAVGPNGEPAKSFLSEVQLDATLRGPEGTVPIVRFDVEKYIRETKVLPDSVDKLRPLPQLGPAQDIYHNRIAYNFTGTGAGTAYGVRGTMNLWDVSGPTQQDSSIGQFSVACCGDDPPFLDSIEVGKLEYGGHEDPWLFVYLNNTRYDTDEDPHPGGSACVGGYVGALNETAFHQVSSLITPEMPLPGSTPGGTQMEMSVTIEKYLYGRAPWPGRWLVRVAGEFVGYYENACFHSDHLAMHADFASFHGEVLNSNFPDGATSTDMGSGYWPSAGYGYTAYARNLRWKTFLNSWTYFDNTFPPMSYLLDDPGCYAMWWTANQSGSWTNYLLYGGPGKGSSAPNCGP